MQLAFTLQIVTDVIQFFAVSIRFCGEIDNYMTSAQRVMEYTKLESEDDIDKPGDEKLKESKWPDQGKIEFHNVTMRYRESLEPSVKELDFVVQPNMKVGIVGRTGAGKSSILQALFRLCELSEGKIIIDGHDIKDIGLHMLRKSIAYIP